MMVEIAPVAPAPSFEITEYGPQDEQRAVDFLKLVLGEGGTIPRTAEFWRWKHQQNPFGPSRVLFASNGEVLGLRAFMRWTFRTPGGSLHAVRAVDTSTHPAARRLGIFSRLTAEALARVKSEGVHLVFNTPNPQSMAGYLKLGWHPVERPRLLVRPLRPIRIALALGRRRRRILRAADVPGFFRRPPRTVPSLLEHEDRVGQMLDLDDGFRATGIRTDRSPAFLRWRYAAAPVLPYYAHWIGDRPVTGFLLYRPNFRRTAREIMLCEVVMGYGALRQMGELLEDLIRTVEADYIVASAAPGGHHWAVLRRLGFWPLPANAGPHFVVHPLDLPSGAPDPRRLDSWRLSLGDLEVF